MKKSDGQPEKRPTSFDDFTELTRKLLAVPKAEIDKREAEYQRRQKNKKPKRGPKPGPKSK